MNRRSLITGLVSLVAAPAIVRADALMRVAGERYFVWQKTLPLLPNILRCAESEAAIKAEMAASFGPNGGLYYGTWTYFGKDRNIYSDEVIHFRKWESEPAQL